MVFLDIVNHYCREMPGTRSPDRATEFSQHSSNRQESNLSSRITLQRFIYMYMYVCISVNHMYVTEPSFKASRKTLALDMIRFGILPCPERGVSIASISRLASLLKLRLSV